MGACFGLIVRDFDTISQEFYTAHKMGLSYSDWRQMTRWQIADYIARTALDRRARGRKLQGKDWKHLIGVAFSRLLGLS